MPSPRDWLTRCVKVLNELAAAADSAGTAAGEGRADVLLPGLAVHAPAPPSPRELATALDPMDLTDMNIPTTSTASGSSHDLAPAPAAVGGADGRRRAGGVILRGAGRT